MLSRRKVVTPKRPPPDCHFTSSPCPPPASAAVELVCASSEDAPRHRPRPPRLPDDPCRLASVRPRKRRKGCLCCACCPHHSQCPPWTPRSPSDQPLAVCPRVPHPVTRCLSDRRHAPRPRVVVPAQRAQRGPKIRSPHLLGGNGMSGKACLLLSACSPHHSSRPVSG